MLPEARDLCLPGLVGLMVCVGACSSGGATAVNPLGDASPDVHNDVAEASVAAPEAGADASNLADANADASTADADADGVRVHGVVIFDRLNGQKDIPAHNRPIGVVGGGPSTTTAADGGYSLTLAPGSDVVLRATLDGEVSVERALVVPSKDTRFDLHVIDIDAYVGAVSAVGGNVGAWSTGAVVVRFSGSKQAGFSATLGAASDGSFVFNSKNGGFPKATDTTLAPGDSLYFYNVTPDTTTLAIIPPGDAGTCSDPLAPASSVYPVDKLTLTEIVLSCN